MSSFMQTDEACPAGRPIESAVEAQTARLIASCWSEPSRRRQLLGHKGRVFDFQYHSSESRALSCSEDGTVRIWNMTQGTSEGSALKGSKDEVLRVCWTPDTAEPSALVSGGADGQVRIWNKRTFAATLSKQSPLRQAAAGSGPVIKCIAKLDHTGEGLDGQVYALQFVPLPPTSNSNSSSSSGAATAAAQPAVAYQLMVATDDTLSFWNAATGQRTACWRFPAAESPAPPIGGAARNPNATVYIFDAK
eukprot:4627-Heterococcus_DN1.PRE.1